MVDIRETGRERQIESLPVSRVTRENPPSSSPTHFCQSLPDVACVVEYRGTSIIRYFLLLGPYIRPMPMALWWSYGGGQFFMSDVPLHPRFFDEQLGSAVGAIDYVRGSSFLFGV
jgi:hypothetical protein